MCRPLGTNKRNAARAKRVLKSLRADLLRYHSATARLNASVRRAFPPEKRLARVMERNSSGTINDAPGEIQSFVGAVEDACYSHCPEEASSLTDGVGQAIESARAWAGRPPLSIYGDFMYSRCVTWVEKCLVLETRAAAEAFFQKAYSLPGVDKKSLLLDEATFLLRHENLTREIGRANYDPVPEQRLLLVLGRRFPLEVCRGILAFTF